MNSENIFFSYNYLIISASEGRGSPTVFQGTKDHGKDLFGRITFKERGNTRAFLLGIRKHSPREVPRDKIRYPFLLLPLASGVVLTTVKSVTFERMARKAAMDDCILNLTTAYSNRPLS